MRVNRRNWRCGSRAKHEFAAAAIGADYIPLFMYRVLRLEELAVRLPLFPKPVASGIDCGRVAYRKRYLSILHNRCIRQPSFPCVRLPPKSHDNALLRACGDVGVPIHEYITSKLSTSYKHDSPLPCW